MTAPTAGTEYFLVQFTDITEAAAFVAALSRYLSSPLGSKYLRPAAAAEVRSLVVGESELIARIDVYLNAPALDAVKNAFGRLPAMSILRGSPLPPECILLIGSGGVKEWGIEEAQWHILSER